MLRVPKLREGEEGQLMAKHTGRNVVCSVYRKLSLSHTFMATSRTDSALKAINAPDFQILDREPFPTQGTVQVNSFRSYSLAQNSSVSGHHAKFGLC